MNLNLVLIIIGYSINCLSADESDKYEIVEGTTKENLTDIYYKGRTITKPESFCKKNTCLTKCCPIGFKYNITSKICVSASEVFDPQIYDEYLRLQSSNASDLFYFKTGIIRCKNKMARFLMSVFAIHRNREFHLRVDGNLYIESPHSIPPWISVGPDNYCIDNFVEETDGENITNVDALVCFAEDDDHYDFVLTATCMLVSCVFILLTVGVYIWLPKLHNVHGRVLIAYLTCLFVGFLFMATMQLLLHYDKGTDEACQSMTFVIYFSLLSAFFWLNVMCYDIWRVFSGKREIRPQKLLVWAQMRSYSLYAFGIPTILTILLISLEYSGLPQNPWLPLIRFKGCFLSGTSKLLYLYVPILILCVANLVLFVLTAVKIAMTRKETSVLSSRESSRHDQSNDKQTYALFLTNENFARFSNKQYIGLLLYVKLFILMGISWILEVFSALYPSKHWRVSDVYNVLIGLVIFIIFVCKRQIFNLLKERIKEKFQQCGRGDMKKTNRINSVTHRESQETIGSNVVADLDIGEDSNVTSTV